ncbi:SurA N-terminal domain-containing protein [Amphibacillus sp. Q70]|uniref:SurA N-terminal domain-containing protein n=1 Tax=Amphibacillus sp. Q70 TaxID=3453416 RepID=UPI003F85952E
MLNKITTGGLMLLLSMTLIACNSHETNEDSEHEQLDETVKMPNITEEPDDIEEIVTADELVDEDLMVLVVNGEEVYGDSYNLVYIETKNTLLQNSDQVDDLDQVHEETMTALIRQTLLAQDAYQNGIVVTDSEADAIYQDTKAQFETEEEFYQTLDQLPYTEEVFRDILVKSLLQQYYIDQEFSDISISNEDVENFYDILQEQMEEAPELADIRTEIENQLYQTEIQNALNDRLDQLLAEAEIEELL